MKRFFVSFLLSLMVVVLPFAGIKIKSYAEGTINSTTIELNYNVRDAFRYTGALPTSDDTYTMSLSLRGTTPPQSEYDYSRLFPDITNSDSVVISFCDSGKNPYATTESGGYTVLTTLPTGVKALKYNSNSMFVDVAADYIGALTVNYFGTITSGGSTYDTDVGTITFNISNTGIYYKNGYSGDGIKVPYEDADSITFDEAYFRNYLLCAYNNGTTIPAADIGLGTYKNGGVIFEGIDTDLVNTPQSICCLARDNGTTIMEYMSLTIVQEVAVQDTLGMKHNGSLIPATTPSNRYTIAMSAGETITGTLECTNGWSAVSISSSSTDFNVSSRIEGEDGEEYISYTISQKTLQVGTFDLEVVLEDSVEGSQKSVYLTINVSTAVAPTFVLYNEELNIRKNSSMTELNDMFRANIQSVTLYDGSTLDTDIVNNPLKVIIECDIDDITISGSYFVNYSYTDSDTGLTGTARATLNVIDVSPELYSVEARTKEDNSLINNNDPNDGVAMGAEIVFKLDAVDDDGDDILYFGSVSNSFGTLTQDGTDSSIFTFTPKPKIAGEITFTFYASDDNSASENVYYTIYYLDTQAPTITFTNDIQEVDGSFYLSVSRKVVVEFNNYIVSVSDNSSTLSNNDVVITPTGFEFLEGNRFKFENVTGEFSVKYSLTDDSGNEFFVVVNISVQNEAPTAENVYVDSKYQDAVSVDLASYAKDDTKLISFVGVGMITDSFGQPVATDTFTFGTDGKVNVKLSTVYSEAQGRRIPFVGKAYIRYKVVDGDGASSPEYSIELNIIDDTKPEVSAVEGTKTTFIKGREQTFSKEGYFTAIDEVDGVLTPSSIMLYQYETPVATIDFSRLGNYKLVYVFTDNSGNSETKELTLTVTAGSKPVIELLASGTTIAQGGDFDMYNFIISIKDEEDGTKTSGWKEYEEQGFLIIIDDAVNTAKSGRYEIRMFCVDSDGNASEEVIFTLIVEEAPAGFPMWIIYVIGGAVGLVGAIIVIRVVVRKRKMRI